MTRMADHSLELPIRPGRPVTTFIRRVFNWIYHPSPNQPCAKGVYLDRQPENTAGLPGATRGGIRSSGGRLD